MPGEYISRTMGKERKSAQTVIGWREWVALPDIGVDRIKAKVDTGARSSSLHAFRLRHFDRGGEPWVRFQVHPAQRKPEPSIDVEAKVLEYREVRSSSGKTSRRPVIVTRVALLGESWPIELTLASRDEMGFRMLLGREAIKGRFLVDSANSFYGSGPSGKRKSGRHTHTSNAGPDPGTERTRRRSVS